MCGFLGHDEEMQPIVPAALTKVKQSIRSSHLATNGTASLKRS